MKGRTANSRSTRRKPMVIERILSHSAWADQTPRNTRSQRFSQAIQARILRDKQVCAKIGRKPVDHLRRLVETTRLDEFRLTEQTAEGLQDELCAMAQLAGYGEPAHSVGLDDASPPRLAIAEVQELIQEIRQGITRYLRGPGWVVPMDGLRRFVIRRKLPRLHRMKYVEGRLRPRVLSAVADLLDAEGARLKVCPACKNLYVKQKRQQFCSNKCGQGERTRRYRAQHREEINERRREAYKRKWREKLGPNVKIRSVGPRRAAQPRV